MQTILMMHMTE